MAAGLSIALAGPAALWWRALQPEALDPQHLRVRFESVWAEGKGLVFLYSIDNRTARSVRLLPNATTIRMRQADGHPVVGYPVVSFPLDIEAHSRRKAELRVELAELHFEAELRRISQPQAEHDVDSLFAESLRIVEGFELVNPEQGIRIVFPRGW